MGRRMQVGVRKFAIFDHYLALSRAVNAATVRRYKHSAVGPGQVSDSSLVAVSGGVCL